VASARRFELKELQMKLGITSIYVTHDQSEAMVMADRIAVLYKGAVQQLAPAKTIYQHPSTRFVSSFIGQTNLIRAEVHIKGGNDDFVEVVTEIGVRVNVAAPLLGRPVGSGQDVRISIRPENIALSRQEAGEAGKSPSESPTEIRGKVIRKFNMGSCLDHQIGVGDHVLRVQTHPRQAFGIGDEVILVIDPTNCHCIVD
jgi:iron(III) transport system ATP-binding protein